MHPGVTERRPHQHWLSHVLIVSVCVCLCVIIRKLKRADSFSIHQTVSISEINITTSPFYISCQWLWSLKLMTKSDWWTYSSSIDCQRLACLSHFGTCWNCGFIRTQRLRLHKRLCSEIGTYLSRTINITILCSINSIASHSSLALPT